MNGSDTDELDENGEDDEDQPMRPMNTDLATTEEAKKPTKNDSDGDDEWDIDDVVDWGEKNETPAEVKPAALEEEKKEESALESLQRINREHREQKSILATSKPADQEMTNSDAQAAQ